MAAMAIDSSAMRAARRRAAEQLAEEARLASRRATTAEDRAAFALLEVELRPAPEGAGSEGNEEGLPS